MKRFLRIFRNTRNKTYEIISAKLDFIVGKSIDPQEEAEESDIYAPI